MTSLGSKYSDQFEQAFQHLAEIYDAPLIPFLLEDEITKPKLNQVDGIHPTAEGHALVAERVWEKLVGLLNDEK